MALPSLISIGQVIMPAKAAEEFVTLLKPRSLSGCRESSWLAIHHFSMEDTGSVIEAGQLSRRELVSSRSNKQPMVCSARRSELSSVPFDCQHQPSAGDRSGL